MRTSALAASVCVVCTVLAKGPACAKDPPLDPPRIASVDPRAEQAWADQYLDKDDWILAGYANDQFWLVSSEETAHNDYPHVLDWVRIEKGGPLNPALSSASALWQVEVDCAKSAYRPTRMISYRYNNLRGAVLGDLPNKDGKFVTGPPGSVIAAVLEAICKSAAANAPARP
jgi:hypothetical protein